jgi:hypothetical protein
MAIPRDYRFPIEFDIAFPQGLVLVGEVAPDNEYQTREDKAAGRPVRQKTDPVTSQRQWKATVTDPDEPTAKRASFEITFTADVQPVAPTAEVLPGMRPIALQGLTAEPKVAGNGEFNTSPTSTGQPDSPRPPARTGLVRHRRASWPAASRRVRRHDSGDWFPRVQSGPGRWPGRSPYCPASYRTAAPQYPYSVDSWYRHVDGLG